MLELKGLTKTYKSKKGVAVQALKDVSLSFQDSGMVFVLGRSGSGKSTLLNIVGGLDSADSGEIVIDGKSSKDFKTSDYDAYRNTYIGFVFQDYNILDDFTVGENIMLALELQHQKADKERLESILKEVDLEGYADRRPNELSGGQKQRVAIARALVKNPHIIMADEPTGALDEETGIQVLETLKKMSKDKLVIVVSHDREFAEQYGDRIIRLSDGKVKSDTAVDNATAEGGADPTSPSKIKAEMSSSRLPYRYALKMGAHGVWSKPFRLIVTILLCMVSFTAFGVVDTANAFNAKKVALDAYLNSPYEVSAYTAYVPASDNSMDDTYGASEKDVARLKEKTGIDYVGVTLLEDRDRRSGYGLELISIENARGNNHSVYYTQSIYGFYPASQQFFQSMNFSLIGKIPEADNEIVITQYIFDQINLCGIALFAENINDGFVTEMVARTLLPDSSRTAQSLIEQELFISFANNYFKIVGVVDTREDSAGKYESLKPSKSGSSNTQLLLEAECVDYFRYGYHSIGYISQDRYDSIVKSYSAELEGWDAFGVPAKGEISVSQGGTSRRSKFWGVASDKDLDKVKDVIWLDGDERTKLNDKEYVIGLNTALKYLQGGSLIEENTYYTHDKSYFGGIASFGQISFRDLYNSSDMSRKFDARYIACFEEAEKIQLEKLNIFKEYVHEKIDTFPDGFNLTDGKENFVLSLFYNEISLANNVRIQDESLEYSLEKLEEKHWRALYAGYILKTSRWSWYNGSSYFEMDCGYDTNITGCRTGEALERIDAKVIYVKAKLKTSEGQKLLEASANCEFNSSVNVDDLYDTKIVGIYVPQDNFPEIGEMDTFIFNNAIYRSLENVELSPYSFLLAPMPTERNQLAKLVEAHYEEAGRVLKMHNGIVIELNLVQDPIYSMKVKLLAVGLGLAIFSIIMLANYIGTSVSNKKKDIGILRALGAKTRDVFAIFVSESIIISLINAVASIIVTIFACMGLNVLIRNETQVDLSVLNFGIRQVVIMIIINVAIAVLASLIPIYRMSKKKPIDCIHDK